MRCCLSCWTGAPGSWELILPLFLPVVKLKIYNFEGLLNWGGKRLLQKWLNGLPELKLPWLCNVLYLKQMTLDSTDKSILSCSYCNGMQSFPSTGDYFTSLYIQDPQHEMSHLKNTWPLSHSSRTVKQSSVVNHTILALLYNWVSKNQLRLTMIRF